MTTNILTAHQTVGILASEVVEWCSSLKRRIEKGTRTKAYVVKALLASCNGQARRKPVASFLKFRRYGSATQMSLEPHGLFHDFPPTPDS
jgi:hypothetical protein